MIRALQLKSSAKISVAKAMIPETSQRNVFVEGPVETYNIAKKLIDSIIEEHMKLQMSFKTHLIENDPSQLRTSTDVTMSTYAGTNTCLT